MRLTLDIYSHKDASFIRFLFQARISILPRKRVKCALKPATLVGRDRLFGGYAADGNLGGA